MMRATEAVIIADNPISSLACKVCSAETNLLFKAKVLGKFDVAYLKCTSCEFIQTEQPYWLNESYTSAINSSDLGPINRAMIGSEQVEGIILSSLDASARFIDYGGGYGVFVRLMRDKGFDFYWQDRYCDNLFAQHFVAQKGVKYELLTAFEVFEHLVEPLAEIEQMLIYSENLLFSTKLVPPNVKQASDWWYFSTTHGQHISFYTIPALEVIAKRFGLHLATDGHDNHMLSQKKVSQRQFRFFCRRRVSAPVRSVLRRRLSKQSLLLDDFFAATLAEREMHGVSDD